MPLKRRAAPRAEIMGWDGSAWQRLPVESSANPNLRVGIYEGTNIAEVETSGSDGLSNITNQLITGAMKYGFNGTSWDRWRNNVEFTVLASATRTATGNSASQTNYNAKGVMVFINITAVSGTFAAGEGLKIIIRGKDPTSGTATWLAHTGALTSPGTYLCVCYPGATDVQAIGAVYANDIPLPRTWDVRYEITGTNPSFTFSVGASYVV